MLPIWLPLEKNHWKNKCWAKQEGNRRSARCVVIRQINNRKMTQRMQLP